MSDIPEHPSKSELKRRSSNLQELGEALIDLPDGELATLPLPESLRDAVLLARRITQHGGLYRQKQYIGKLMRSIDAEPIRAALDARRERQRTEVLRFRRIEQWRDRLLAEGSAALEHLRAERPGIDSEVIAALVRQAQKEQQTNAAPRAARELFQLLRATLSA